MGAPITSGASSEYLRTALETARACMNAAMRYRPRPYAGPLDLFQASAGAGNVRRGWPRRCASCAPDRSPSPRSRATTGDSSGRTRRRGGDRTGRRAGARRRGRECDSMDLETDRKTFAEHGLHRPVHPLGAGGDDGLVEGAAQGAARPRQQRPQGVRQPGQLRPAPGHPRAEPADHRAGDRPADAGAHRSGRVCWRTEFFPKNPGDAGTGLAPGRDLRDRRDEHGDARGDRATRRAPDGAHRAGSRSPRRPRRTGA